MWRQPPRLSKPGRSPAFTGKPWAEQAVSSAQSPAQLPQSLPRRVQSLQPLAEREPYLPRTIPRITIKTRPRHRRHANVFHQILCEGNIIVESEGADVRHHVVRSPRTKAFEACCG